MMSKQKQGKARRSTKPPTGHQALAELADLRKETCSPTDSAGVYVGLEHIDPGYFALRRHGMTSDVRSAKSRFYAGDVLYGKLRPYLDKAVVADCEGICSTDILVLEPRGVPSWFLCGLLHTDRFIEHAKQTTHGVNHPRTSWAGVNVFEIVRFTNAEQEKIAAVLLNIQRAIETQDRMIQALGDLKKSTLQHVFTRGLRGEVWTKKHFGQLATLHRGYDLPVQAREGGGVPIIGSNGIVGYHHTAKVKGPGVVTGRSGSIGISYYLDEDYWPLNTALYVSDFHGNHPRYVHYFIEWFDLSRFKAGVSVPTLNRNTVHKILVEVPPLSAQKNIAFQLQSIEKCIHHNSCKKASLQSLFKTALNKLMSGEIWVGELEIETAEVAG